VSAVATPVDGPTRALLADGSPVLLVGLGPEDAAELLDLHGRLSDRDRYFRFGTLHPADLENYLEHTLARDSGALSLGARFRGRLIGAVQLIPCGGDAGEVAAVVDAAWRDHGLVTVLLEQLAAAALRRGIGRLIADVLAENGPMLRVLEDLGLPVAMTREGTSLRIEVVLHPDERYAEAAEDRHRVAAAASLRAVLDPASVVVIGAGRGEQSIGRAVLRKLRSAGFRGEVLAVNPHATEIDGVPCRASVAELPPEVDLAVLTVPAGSVEATVAECGEHGVRALVLISSGVSGIPGAGERIRAVADRYGMRIVGPNTVGVVGPGRDARLDTTFTAEIAPAGDLALVTQSGGVAIAAVTGWRRLGLGLSAMVAIGDALDVGARDVLAWCDEDPGTALVVLYAESEPDLRGLVRTAAHLAARVPVLALESGTSVAGQRAAASHTARAATPVALREAAYAAGGIQSVTTLTDLTAAAALMRGQPLPAGRSVVVLTNLGGGGVMAADACIGSGLRVDPLPPDLQAQLRALLPPLASTTNPVDTSAAVTAAEFAAALTCLLESPAVDAVLTVTAPTAVSDPAPGVVRGVAAAAAARPTPVVDVQLTRPTTLERLELPGAPPGNFLVSVDDPGTAARALGAAVRRAAWLSRGPSAPVLPAGVDIRAAQAVVRAVLTRAPDGTWLRPPEIDTLCRAGGLATVPTTWVTTGRAAADAAARADGPVAVKGHVAGVVHKGDAGLLRLPVSDPAEAAHVVDEWAARAGDRWLGAVVQPLVPPGDEFLVGAVRDASAGPVVAFGPGGRAADALGHRMHRLAPLTAADVEELLAGTGMLATTHGRSLDDEGIADCLRRVGWLADAVPEIAELEVNPLVVTPHDSAALDVRIRVAPAPSTAVAGAGGR
jgi:acyl-CoA synthetase (NDP forming)/RimJ/RimL family protein N-acetyltransferase